MFMFILSFAFVQNVFFFFLCIEPLEVIITSLQSVQQIKVPKRAALHWKNICPKYLSVQIPESWFAFLS